MLRTMNRQGRSTTQSGHRVQCPRCQLWRYTDEVELCQRCTKSNNPIPPRIRKKLRRNYTIKI